MGVRSLSPSPDHCGSIRIHLSLRLPIRSHLRCFRGSGNRASGAGRLPGETAAMLTALGGDWGILLGSMEHHIYIYIHIIIYIIYIILYIYYYIYILLYIYSNTMDPSWEMQTVYDITTRFWEIFG